ncbi:hypothetical protein B7486_10670 [cyanobacterium TDX16]|nr:hypothetical protein B7486_10670 [cyanobacterium TDX16]
MARPVARVLHDSRAAGIQQQKIQYWERLIFFAEDRSDLAQLARSLTVAARIEAQQYQQQKLQSSEELVGGATPRVITFSHTIAPMIPRGDMFAVDQLPIGPATKCSVTILRED